MQGVSKIFAVLRTVNHSLKYFSEYTQEMQQSGITAFSKHQKKETRETNALHKTTDARTKKNCNSGTA